MNEIIKTVLLMVSAIMLMACESQSDDESRHFCDNEKALLQINAVDTAIWDLELSMDSFLLDILNQTGSDSCDGSKNMYLQVELPEFGETFIPARVGNPYCSCCPDVPSGRVRKLTISITGNDIVLFKGYPLNQKFLGEQLIYETNYLFIGNHHATYQLEWANEVVPNEMLAVLQTILTSFFNSMEENYAVDKQGLCNLASVSEVPRLILMIEKEAIPPPPPPIPDSIKDSGNLE